MRLWAKSKIRFEFSLAVCVQLFECMHAGNRNNCLTVCVTKVFAGCKIANNREDARMKQVKAVKASAVRQQSSVLQATSL